MPMEQIHGIQRNAVDITDPKNPKPVPPTHTRLDVHWSKSLGDTVNVNAVWFEDAEDIKSSYPVEMDRGAVNKLIRDLRRARTQVFGADE